MIHPDYQFVISQFVVESNRRAGDGGFIPFGGSFFSTPDEECDMIWAS